MCKIYNCSAKDVQKAKKDRFAVPQKTHLLLSFKDFYT